ncbi:MAG: sulfotransferase [Pseudonocardiales bacterium]
MGAVSRRRPVALRMPDFIIIGAFKSGTTSLLSWLGQHPKVFVPWLQEPNFFASPNYNPQLDGEKRPQRPAQSIYGRKRTDSLSQYTSLFEGVPEDVVAGESSPQYLREPAACGRIKCMLPDAKLIAILRHPADRAFSDYSMLVRDGLERGSFVDAIGRPHGTGTFPPYLETGFYGRQLKPYIEQFPPEQLRVLLFEDLRDDPRDLIRSLLEWFDVDPNFEPNVADVRNVSGVPRNRAIAGAYRMRRRLQPYLKPLVPAGLQRVVDARLLRGLDRPEFDPQIRRQLVELYAEDIQQLAQLIGRDLADWLR